MRHTLPVELLAKSCLAMLHHRSAVAHDDPYAHSGSPPHKIRVFLDPGKEDGSTRQAGRAAS